MRYGLNLAGFEGQIIEVESPGIFGSPKLLVNGIKVNNDKKTRCMLLQKSDGTQAKCRWKPKALGLDVPALEVDGKEIQIARPLHWAIWVWCFIPVILIFIGGALGGLLGAVGAAVNIMLFRSNLNMVAKIVLTIVVTVLAYVIFFFLVVLLQVALRR
jgi:hypothetical protein